MIKSPHAKFNKQQMEYIQPSFFFKNSFNITASINFAQEMGQ